MINQAYIDEYFGEKAVYLRAGTYEAILLPEIGGNMIAFRDIVRNFRFLREPSFEEMKDFKKIPYIHGIPVLFPPNRYENGEFPWQGQTYRFPINEPSTGNHLHGFVHNVPWTIEQISSDEMESRVTVALVIDVLHPVYEYFPHLFTIRLQYTLSGEGLLQRVTVRNDGNTRMPCLLAFHTTINAPFAQNGHTEDYLFKMTIGKRWELNDRMLPTVKFQPLTSNEENMRSGFISPFFEPMDNHYTADPQDGRNRMELKDRRNKVKLIYDVGTAYRQWMIWNNDAQGGYFCPEPQISLVNAPMISLPANQSGLFALEQGELWEETSRLYCIDEK
ncbi:MAG: aldose epimerase [Bacilli bacterium]|jgi:aldose 1-epimerase|nr:aldose epimerase [Bacilli bacterium]